MEGNRRIQVHCSNEGSVCNIMVVFPDGCLDCPISAHKTSVMRSHYDR